MFGLSRVNVLCRFLWHPPPEAESNAGSAGNVGSPTGKAAPEALIAADASFVAAWLPKVFYVSVSPCFTVTDERPETRT
jgi:hypothetical protein